MADFTTPTKMGSVEMTNRVVMAPLTRNRARPDGVPGPLAKTYYEQRATAGLIITEATQISPRGKGYINTPGIYTKDQIDEWKNITDAVHAKGGKIFVQLWHVGRISHISLLPEGEVPVAPTALRANAQTFIETGPVDVSEPRALTPEEIPSIVAEYAHAAECAKQAGFDGVEVHAANGYLLDQFLQDKTNQRDDAYGGSIENRMRLLVEVLDAVTGILGSEKVGVRLSPTGTFNDMGDSDPLTHFGAVIERLNAFNLAYLHIVERFPGIESSAQQEDVVKELRARWKGFYIANGDYARDDSGDVLQSGYADAVAFGRSYISNPDLVERLQRNTDLNDPDPATFYGGGAEGYTDYPTL